MNLAQKLDELEALKFQLDGLTTDMENLADGQAVRAEEFNQYNNLVVYLQESRRSLRQALKTLREIV